MAPGGPITTRLPGSLRSTVATPLQDAQCPSTRDTTISTRSTSTDRSPAATSAPSTSLDTRPTEMPPRRRSPTKRTSKSSPLKSTRRLPARSSTLRKTSWPQWRSKTLSQARTWNCLTISESDSVHLNLPYGRARVGFRYHDCLLFVKLLTYLNFCYALYLSLSPSSNYTG